MLSCAVPSLQHPGCRHAYLARQQGQSQSWQRVKDKGPVCIFVLPSTNSNSISLVSSFSSTICKTKQVTVTSKQVLESIHKLNSCFVYFRNPVMYKECAKSSPCSSVFRSVPSNAGYVPFWPWPGRGSKANVPIFHVHHELKLMSAYVLGPTELTLYARRARRASLRPKPQAKALALLPEQVVPEAMDWTTDHRPEAQRWYLEPPMQFHSPSEVQAVPAV